MIDDQLIFIDHIVIMGWFCRFALYNIRKIRPFKSYSLNSGRPSSQCFQTCATQTAAARVVFNESERARHTAFHQFALAANNHSHQIKGIDVCLKKHWLCTHLPKFSTSGLFVLQKPGSCKWMVHCCAVQKRHNHFHRLFLGLFSTGEMMWLT